VTSQAHPNLPVTSRQPLQSNSSPVGIQEMLLQPTNEVNWEDEVPSRNCALAYCLTEHLQCLKVNLTFFSKLNVFGGGGQQGRGLRRGWAAGRAGFWWVLCWAQVETARWPWGVWGSWCSWRDRQLWRARLGQGSGSCRSGRTVTQPTSWISL